MPPTLSGILVAAFLKIDISGELIAVTPIII
jgi:hypothetical protein